MSYTMRDLLDMLKGNPDLQIDRDYMMPTNRLNGRPYGEVTLPKMSEHDFQVALIAECDRRALTNPLWGMIFAIPNGQYRKGQRMEPGLRPGIPDLFVARHRCATDKHPAYHGAFIELKVGDGKPSKVQLEWIATLRNQGYFVTVVWDSPSKAMGVLEWYLEGE